MKTLTRDGNVATLEVSGAFAEAYGFGGNVADFLASFGYLLNNGFRQSVGDAGAMPKGTPEADVKAARRERFEALKAGYSGNGGGSRTPLWARLAAGVLNKTLVGDAKPSDVVLALVRDDGKAIAKMARKAGLNADKVAEHVKAKVEWGKREAARREAEAAAAETVDLADLS